MKNVADDDSFAEQLAALDDDLAQGTRNHHATPVEDARLASACQVLARLESIWPRQRAASILPEGFDRFRLIRILGVGGFGIVYLAHDQRLRRDVALKMPRPEMLLTATLRERFLREARAAAQLQHPHIVPIYDSGVIGSCCYLVAVYCPGGNLADWLRKRTAPVPCAIAASVVSLLADAVHHAHQRGILHRDLKPANILLTPSDDAHTALDFTYVPQVADFGLAKAVQGTDLGAESGLTRSGAFLGTPAYMAPEQAHRSDDVTVAVDVYALGAILYELLTGQAPFRGASDLEVLRLVTDAEPTPPRHWRRDLPRDLEAICLKCLEKRPERRYADAAALAADLRRFLGMKPTIARPLNWAQRAARAMRRHPYLSASLLAFVVVLATAAGAVNWHLGQLDLFDRERAADAEHREELRKKARESAELAARRKRQVQLQEYVNHLGDADALCKEKRFPLAREVLLRYQPGADGDDVRDFAWRYLWRRMQGGITDFPLKVKQPVVAVGFSRDGRRLFTATVSSWLECHDTVSGRRLWYHSSLGAVNQYTSYVLFSPDGGRVAAFAQPTNVWSIFETADPDLQSLYKETFPVGSRYGTSDFSANGERFVLGLSYPSSGAVIKIVSLKEKTSTPTVEKEDYHPQCTAFSPDGKALAAVLTPYKKEMPLLFLVHDLDTGEQTFVPAPPKWGRAQVLRWSPDGKTLACSAIAGNPVVLWNTRPLGFRCALPATTYHSNSIAFSPDGQHLAVVEKPTGPKGNKVRTFRVKDGTPNPRVFEAEEDVLSVAWSPTENLLALGSRVDPVRLWNPLDADDDQILPGHQGSECWGVAFAPDGRTLASTGDDWMLRLWDPNGGASLGSRVGHLSLASCVAYSPDGRWLATGSYDKTVILRDVKARLNEVQRCKHEHHLRCLAFSRDSKLLASAGRDLVVRLWNPETGEDAGILQGHKKTVRALAFHPRQNLLASASDDGTIRLWDADESSLVRTLKQSDDVWSVAFSPDGQTLASGAKDGSITFWNVADGQAVAILHKHTQGVRSLAFSPDGKILASGSQDKTVRLINVELHQEILAFPPQSHEINGVAFSPDSAYLAAALHDGTIVVWHGPTR